MSRGVKWSLAILLGLLALLFALLALLLVSETGSRWALERVPGLSLQGFQGRLAGRWQAERLVWQQGARRVELLAPHLNWSPGCLLRLTLCVKQLEVEEVVLDFPPGAPTEDGGPLQLPTLRLPFAVQASNLRIGRLLLNGNEQVRDVQLDAQW